MLVLVLVLERPVVSKSMEASRKTRPIMERQRRGSQSCPAVLMGCPVSGGGPPRSGSGPPWTGSVQGWTTAIWGRTTADATFTLAYGFPHLLLMVADLEAGCIGLVRSPARAST